MTALFALTIIATVLGVFMTLFWHPHPPRENSPRASCQSNLKQIALLALQYREDYDAYPPAHNPPNPQWEQLYPSAISTAQAFQCPSDENATDTSKNSYGYNANLGGRKMADKKSSVSTIMYFEVKAKADNKTQTGKTLAAVTAHKRHLDGANYAFTDGHVKWLMPERVKSASPDEENFTFAVE